MDQRGGPVWSRSKSDSGKPENVNVESAQDEVIQPMRRLRHLITGKDNDFEISSPDFLSHLWNQLTGALVILTGVISSIGLVVGGIGIMNIMLISVTERTHESACARRSARAAPISGCSFFWASLSYLWVGIGFTISVSVGLFFGYYPAILAPIVCLGYE